MQAAVPDAASIGAAQPVPIAPRRDEAVLFASPTTHDHIGRVVVPIMINGQGPFRFIVDTGANHSTISPGLVHTLGLTPSESPSIILDGITGTAQVSFVTVDQLRAGDLSMGRTALPVVWSPVMAGADGILGAAGLAEKTLLIDFQRNRVTISRGIEAQMRADATKIHAQRLAGDLIVLQTQVGGVPVRAVLDTGAERTLANIALRDALKVRQTHAVTALVTSVYGATKEVESGEIQITPPIVIDSLRITDVAVVFGQFHIFKVWGLEDKPAMVIGMDVLGTVASLGIDFKNQDVYVTSAKPRSDLLSTIRAFVTADPSMKK